MSARLVILRTAIAARPDITWTTGRAWHLYRTHGIPQRRTARRDLHRLTTEGVLTEHGPADARFYTTRRAA
ncbi:hypothetical protein ACIG92_08415 [[Kitasatospora] papulosa]|uniref:hypothetical protein n=1 Tax=[Kitasatospora] papulosa TaxID=1464011 RepID=UPI00362A94BD